MLSVDYLNSADNYYLLGSLDSGQGIGFYRIASGSLVGKISGMS